MLIRLKQLLYKIRTLRFKQLFPFLIVGFLFFGVFVTGYLSQRQQIIQKKAAELSSETSTNELSPGDFLPHPNTTEMNMNVESAQTELNSFRNWERINTTTAPPGRYRAALAYFRPRNTLILFGGWGSNSERFGDTWEFDGVKWSLLNAGSPGGALHGHEMVFDEARERIILFGGIRCTTTCWDINDTYQLIGNQPTWQKINTTYLPSARQGHAMVYDSLRDRILIFGGASGRTFLNDTWEFDGNNWRQIQAASAPSARFNPSMSFDVGRGKVVLQGGYTWGNFLADTWEYDSTNETWQEITQTQGPNSDGDGGFAYDSKISKIVLFGGNSPGFWTSKILDKTWEYDGLLWQEVFPVNKPLPIRTPSMIYFPITEKLIQFGGAYWDAGNIRWLFLNDTWIYINQAPTATQTPTPTVKPSPTPTRTPTPIPTKTPTPTRTPTPTLVPPYTSNSKFMFINYVIDKTPFSGLPGKAGVTLWLYYSDQWSPVPTETSTSIKGPITSCTSVVSGGPLNEKGYCVLSSPVHHPYFFIKSVSFPSLYKASSTACSCQFALRACPSPVPDCLSVSSTTIRRYFGNVNTTGTFGGNVFYVTK